MPNAETYVSFAPPCLAVHSHNRKHREPRSYSTAEEGLKQQVKRDQGRGGLPAVVALPVVADFTAFHEFRHEGCHHAVAAFGATRGRRKRTNTGPLCRI